MITDETFASQMRGLSLASLENGTFVVAWDGDADIESDLSGGNKYIWIRGFPAEGAASPLAAYEADFGDNTLIGGDAPEKFYGFDGDDKVLAGPGDDVIVGGPGDDRVKAGPGDDRMTGGPGRDVLDGGPGNDTADFSGRPPVHVNLSITGWQPTGRGRDKIINVENLVGGLGNDVLIGNAQANWLDGRRGNDKLFGRGGDDVLEGGGRDLLHGGRGKDTALFETNADIRVSLTKTGYQDTGQGKDRLVGIENVMSFAGADTLLGNARANRLAGGWGEDRLVGRGGDDRLFGDESADRLVGGRGADRLDGGLGDDTLTGGAQADVFVFSDGFGHDTITDFQAGLAAEKLDFSGLTAASDPAQFSLGLAADGAGTRITYDASGDWVDLLGVDASAFDLWAQVFFESPGLAGG